MNVKDIQIEDFNYSLPDKRIAKYPLKNRTESKLLIYNKGETEHSNFENLPELLTSGELLIFNSTKVIQARLIFFKETGAKIEIFCLEPYEPSDYEQIFQKTETCKWKCVVGNSKKWKIGNLYSDIVISNSKISLTAKRISTKNDAQIIEFSWNNPNFNFADILENSGETPIPPYLNRKPEADDKIRYQTVYSKQKGSVAAPTAGLHFTKELIQKLKLNEIDMSELILHVGAGTFKPVKSAVISGHEMHTEHFIVSEILIQKLLLNLTKIISVGTTSVRTLESLYWLGLKLEHNKNPKEFHISQWEVYELEDTITVSDALINILDYMKSKHLKFIEATTQIMIVPGYRFKLINKLITNFHQPKSTLLLLIAAFIGENWKNVYDYALNNDFRFLSYGDSSLLIP